MEVKKYFPFKTKKKIGVAVSGGLDSMVLIDILLNISNLQLEVLHCNFKLRNEESDKDEIFIKNFCIKKNIICHIKKFNTLYFSKKNNISIQMAARELRYKWFNKLLEKFSYKYIALGHHFNDSIETFFINILRGTGIKGLLGIPKINKKFIRPLSLFTKEEIIFYAKRKNIKWRSDSSNQNLKYLRNKIRSIIPIISSFSSSFYKGFKKSINFLKNENFFIEKKLEEIHKKITIEKKNDPFLWKIEYKKIENLNYLSKLFYSYGFYNINDLKNFIHVQSGKQLISKKYRLIKNRNFWILVSNKFFLEKKNKIYTINNLELNYNLPINIKFFFNPKKENRKKMLLIDFEKIKLPLQLRTWRQGDFFFPFGMKGKKKVSKYYKDKKFSLFEKEQTWLLINGNNHIILIIENRLDDRFKITKKTKKILGIKI